MNILLPTAYLPPVSYMLRCLMAEHIEMEAWETYPKQTIRNRCYIYSPNGRQCLTVPVTRPYGNHTKTRDIRISYQLPWQQIHWRSLESAYNKSPFFLYYQDEIRPWYHKQTAFLLDFNQGLLESISRATRLNLSWEVTPGYRTSPEGMVDLRDAETFNPESFHPQLYYQVFAGKHGFLPDLSFIDLLFNTGPEAFLYLRTENSTETG